MKSWFENISVFYQNAIIAAVAALLFIPFLGGVHLFDWDEINFAESAREMIATGDYLTVRINFIPFWEKPPLFIWMQALSMKAFGINEFAARFPNSVCGILTLLVLYNTGKNFRSTGFGITWVLVYMGSILPFLYFKSGIIDPWFNLFIFLGTYCIYLYFSMDNRKMRNAAMSAFFIGLAILTKGPVALLVFTLTFTVFLLVKRFRVKIRIIDFAIFIFVLSVTGGFWFILQIFQGNFDIIADFIQYQIRLFRTEDAGHGGFLLYHFVVLFFGVFPASVLALPAFFPVKYAGVKDNSLYLWMMILFWVVLLLFTIVKTKIVHYSSLCYFPLTFLASWAIWYYPESYSKAWKTTVKWLIIFIGCIIALATAMMTFIDRFKQSIISRGWITDKFAEKSLAADGGWKGPEFLTGFILVTGIIFFIIYFRRNLPNRALAFLTISVSVFMMLSLKIIVPRIESYSQRSAIEFFQSVSKQDAYLVTLGYKSYAHLLYGEIKNHSENPGAYDKQWLLTGNIDKPVYASSKITQMDKLMADYPNLELLYEKNGFAFYRRLPGSEIQKHMKD